MSKDSFSFCEEKRKYHILCIKPLRVPKTPESKFTTLSGTYLGAWTSPNNKTFIRLGQSRSWTVVTISGVMSSDKVWNNGLPTFKCSAIFHTITIYFRTLFHNHISIFLCLLCHPWLSSFGNRSLCVSRVQTIKVRWLF